MRKLPVTGFQDLYASIGHAKTRGTEGVPRAQANSSFD
jgi:hypothetical protein